MRGQLSEALPAAQKMFADALTGGDMKKLEAGMKAGTFKSFDLLKVAAHMKDLVDPKQLETMMKTPEKQVIRMKNAWGAMIMAMNQSGLWGVIADGIDTVTQAITDLTPHIKDIAGIIKNLSKFVWENKEALFVFALGWKAVTTAVGVFASAKAAGNVLSMSAAFRTLGLSMVTAFLAPLAAISAVMLALDTYEAYTQHKKGLVADFRVAKNTTELEKALNLPENTPEEKKVRAKTIGDLNWNFLGMEKNPVPDSASIEERYALAQRMRDETGMGRKHKAGFGIPSWITKAETDMLAVQRENTLQLGGLSSNAPQTINITVQNTEPNVTKDWLSSVLPSVLGNALQQHVQKEAAFTPNMLLR